MQTKIVRRAFNLEDCHFSDDLNPLLARIYNARGITGNEQLPRQLKQLHDYRQLKDIDKAASILADAIINKQKILIVGDFDCDGATSSALGTLALRQMGAHVDYLVPNRFEYGYGLTPEIVEAATPFQAEILVTVDNGISSISGVRAAREKGMKVVVTDHHLAGRELPEAHAIVNPNQPGCPFPSKKLCRSGYYFLRDVCSEKLPARQRVFSATLHA